MRCSRVHNRSKASWEGAIEFHECEALAQRRVAAEPNLDALRVSMAVNQSEQEASHA
jgi:hypothetical protein